MCGLLIFKPRSASLQQSYEAIQDKNLHKPLPFPPLHGMMPVERSYKLPCGDWSVYLWFVWERAPQPLLLTFNYTVLKFRWLCIVFQSSNIVQCVYIMSGTLHLNTGQEISSYRCYTYLTRNSKGESQLQSVISPIITLQDHNFYHLLQIGAYFLNEKCSILICKYATSHWSILTLNHKTAWHNMES